MMLVRRPGFSLFGMCLAFAAILGVFTLSGWHSAMVNDADPVHASSIGQSQGEHNKADPDGPIHVVAHAIASIVGISLPQVATVTLVPVVRLWSPHTSFFRAGSDSSRLLRPPQG